MDHPKINEAEKYDLNVMQEAELSRLKRQYRIMEGDRKAFTGETYKKLDKQKKMIRIFKREHQEIMNDLMVTNSELNRRKDREMKMKLSSLLDTHDEYKEEIQTEKNNLNEIDYQLKKIEKEKEKLRDQQITDAEYDRRYSEAFKKKEILENRLENSVKKFCSILYENKKLREQIDHLLKERVQFNKLWEKLMNSLNMGKKFMLDLIEQATIAYGQRDEWCLKLQTLRTRAHNEYLLHNEEMRELQRKLDHDSKLHDFLKVKGQKRIMRDLEIKERKKREKAKEDLEKRIAAYKETLEKIREFSNETDIKRLADNFLKQEEENFALFNYVNELNHELDILTDTIEHLRLNIEEQVEINKLRSEQQKNAITILTRKLEEETEATDLVKKHLTSKENTLQDVFVGIGELFKKLMCDKAPILQLLGDNVDINKHNVMLYLNLISDRVNEIIVSTYYRDKISPRKQEITVQWFSPSDFDLMSVVSNTNCVPASPCPVCYQREMVDDTVKEKQKPKKKRQIQEEFVVSCYYDSRKIHNLVDCQVDESRKILEKRYRWTSLSQT